MTILDRIVADTLAALPRRKSLQSVHALEQRPAFTAPTLSLVQALRSPGATSGPAIIAEVKQASPSAGVIRREFNPVDIAREYKRAGARAISVLTEPLHFRGSLEDLSAVRLAADLPLLRKDFVVDEYQLVEARAFGADAVLLIASLLDKQQLADLHEAAEALGLTPLVEVHSEHELDRLDLDAVRVVGVNNRDLTTFEVDVDRAARVHALLPASVVKVAESGLRTALDLANVSRAGIDAVLIGEAFLRSPEPGIALRRLRDEAAALLQSPLRIAC